jgi:hypothetical protein
MTISPLGCASAGDASAPATAPKTARLNNERRSIGLSFN